MSEYIVYTCDTCGAEYDLQDVSLRKDYISKSEYILRCGCGGVVDEEDEEDKVR